MNRNILFLVTGMTPQIITETVWALACDLNKTDKWIPDEIHVLSTEDGLTQIRATLFDEQVFAKLKSDYPVLTHIKFDKEYLHVISKDGIALKDLKTPADNELAADMICQKVREFTQDDNINLHVSIAGGRKTMGFYAGYALSLYGRSQDRMSHVLVDSEFETAKGFYYPTPTDYFVTQKFTDKRLNAKDAQVWLAQIPFVRMRDAISTKHQLKNEQKTFSEVVKQINESFNTISLKIDLANYQIVVNNKFEFKLPPREFAMLHWFAENRKQGGNGIIAPIGNMKSKDIKKDEISYVAQLTEEYRQYYEDVKKVKGLEFEVKEMKTAKSKSKAVKKKDYLSPLNDNLVDDEIIEDVDKRFFETVKSRLKSNLEEKLGLELASKLELTQDKRGEPFFLNINPDNITIIDSFKD